MSPVYTPPCNPPIQIRLVSAAFGGLLEAVLAAQWPRV
jgi:hypothetical protein